MQVYRTTNLINGKWYIGMNSTADVSYLGSGKLLKQAIEKYGRDNFSKEILEECSSLEELVEREKYWISKTNAMKSKASYNIVAGGCGGDTTVGLTAEQVKARYQQRGYGGDYFQGAKAHFESLSVDEQKAIHAKQAMNRSQNWYVSRLIDPTNETLVKNLHQWCNEHSIDPGAASVIANPNSKSYGKQLKGWRIRNANHPALPPYVNNRNASRPNLACRGKTWKLIDGVRIWYPKEEN